MPRSLGYFGDVRREACGYRHAGASGGGGPVRRQSARAPAAAAQGKRSASGAFSVARRSRAPEMIAAACAHTQKGLVAGDMRHILAIQDTTALRDDGGKNSINLHIRRSRSTRPTVRFWASCTPRCWSVTAARARFIAISDPFAEKESRRWLDAARASEALRAAGASMVTVIGDREGRYLRRLRAAPTGRGGAVPRQSRSRADRRRAAVRQAHGEWRELGRETISLPACPGRRARDHRCWRCAPAR